MRFELVSPTLLERARGGDIAAFEELCAQVGPGLYGLVFSILRNHDDTDEVLQECLVRLHRHLPGLHDTTKFSGWLVRMAVNQCNTLRARSGRDVLQLDDAIDPTPSQLMAAARQPESPRQAACAQETAERVNDAIAALPARQRSAIAMFEINGFSIREIAGAMNCSEGAVKFHIHEARKRLRDALCDLVEDGRPRR